jgi:hypothetical protein
MSTFDDDFAEFPVQDWPEAQEHGKSKADNVAVPVDVEQWELTWDDAIEEDDFGVQLARELQKVQQQQAAASISMPSS